MLAIVAMGLLASRGVSAQSTGTITTVAGGGPGTMAGTAASLRGNVKVVADAAGNLYVSHGFGHRVYRLDAASGILSPLAGDGFSGYSGDGGPALQARISNPYGLALDATQNRLYIADIDNNVIRAVDLATGLISTFAGTGVCGDSGDNGPATSARLCNLLSDLALDSNGTLYFSTDFGGWRIRAVENGVIRTVAGNGVGRGAIDGQGGDPVDDYRNNVPATTASLAAVTAVAVAPFGSSLYFYEQAAFPEGGARFRRVDLGTGVLTTYAGNGLVYGQIDGQGGDPSDDVVEGAPALQSALGYTTSLWASPGGELDAAIYTVGLVRRVESIGDGTAGQIVTLAGGGSNPPLGVPPLSAGLFNPTGVSVDGNGMLYIAAGGHFGSGAEVYASDYFSVINPVVGNGRAGYCGDGGPALGACLTAPTAGRLDPAGDLIVADNGNQVVRSVSAGGVITTLVPSVFGELTDLWPVGPGQFLYSSMSSHAVFRAEPPYAGFTTVAGTGAATGSIDGPGGDPADDLNDGELAWVASLNAPAGVVQDAQGNTFIADSANHRVRRIDATNGLISTVAGTGAGGFNGDGMSGTATDLNEPYGLAFDANGDLLLSERAGHRVRRVFAGGDGIVTGAADETVSTVAGTGVASFSGDGSDATTAALHSPTGLAADLRGNVYIADTGNRAVRKVDRQTGLIETIAGRGTEGDGVPAVSSQLGAPVGLSTAVLDGTSYLYVTDSQQHRVRRIDLGPAAPPANQPPVVDPLGLDGATLTATSPAGAMVALYANATDPDGDPLTYTWSGPFGTANGLGVSVRLPIGVNTVTVHVDDGQGHVVDRSATVTVSGVNTSTGNGEVVTPPDDNEPNLAGETRGRVTVTFLGPVTTPGLTWFRTRTDQLPPPPAGKQLGSSPFYYDIFTTAVADGDVRICLDLTGMSFAFPNQVELHRLGGAWSGLGVSPDPVTHVVCAQAPFAQAFGTHANFTPADALTVVTTVAGTGDDEDSGDGGPAIDAGLHAPEGLALDRARNLLYIGEASHRVRRVNLADGRIETIAGMGAVEDPVDGIDARLSSIGSIAGLALDSDGNLFIGDQSHCLVRRVDRQTNVITTVGGQWRGPGLTCGHTGDGGAATAARLGFPRRLAFDTSGNLLIAESPFLAGSDGGFVRRIAAGLDGRVTGGDPNETITTIAGDGTQDIFVSSGVHPLAAGIVPWDVAVGPGGDVYVAENNGVLLLRPGADGVLDGSPDETVVRVLGTPLGFTLPFQGDGGLARDAYADFVGGLAALPSGDLLVAAPMLRRIRRISAGPDGVVNGGADERIVTIAGFSDDSYPPAFNGDSYALSTRFAWPVELVTDGADAIYVADLSFHRVRRIGPPSGGGGTPTADLSIVASAAPDPVAVGSVLTYAPTVTNHGPDTAHAVRVSLPVPATVDFVGSAPAGWCTGPAAGTAGTIVCDLGDLPPGASNSILIETRPNAAGTVAVTLSVSATETDPNPGNNSATVSVVAQLTPVTLDVLENIVVTDTPTVTPSVMLNVPETIVVTDGPIVTPSVMLNVPESIVVTDTPTLTPSVMLGVAETIVVSDTPVLVVDNTPPTVTIDQAEGQPDPTSRSPIEFTVTFSEPVTGFDASDISFAGSTVGGTLSAQIDRGDSGLTISVSGMTGTGTVVASIPAGAAVDANGNPSLASTSTDNSVLFELAATTTTLTSSRNPSLTTAPTVFTATVAAATPGSAPTGEVEFLRDGVVFGTSPVFERGGAFVAVLGGAALIVNESTHPIKARYLGDGSHEPSTSAAVLQAVLPGTYYGEDVTGPASPMTPVALNDAGQIAGNLGNGVLSRAAVFDPLLGFRTPDNVSPFSEALDLNEAGTVVGRRGPDGLTTGGFVDRNGTVDSIPLSVSATGVNGREQIAINLENGNGAALYEGSASTPLDLFEARAVNDGSVVVGSVLATDGQTDAVLWQGGALTNLGRYGQSFASATRVNNAGTVLVRAGDGFSPELPLLLSRDGQIAGVGEGRAWDVNDADVAVVGTDQARVHLPGTGGTGITLDVGPVTGMAINNRGEIVANVSGQLKRWTPVPTSNLTVDAASGFEGDAVTLVARLTLFGGAPAGGRLITFSLNGQVVGSATTRPSGIAALNGVSLTGLPIGELPQGVRATYAGSPTLGASTATNTLSVYAIDPADLVVRVTASPTQFTVNSNVTFNVLLSNLGPSNATVLRLNVALPAGLQYLSDNAAGACDFSGGQGTCDFENFAPGANRGIAVVARSTASSPQTATFVVSGLRHDPDPANNSAAVTVDASPTVTINQAPGQADPTSTSPIQFAVVFSEPVTGFAGNDISFAGSTVGGTLSASVTGSGASYTVSVTGMSGFGTVAVAIPAGAAVDGGGNPSLASTSTDRTVFYTVGRVFGFVQPANGGNIVFAVVNSGGQVGGVLSFSRGNMSYTSTRITSLVISGQTATFEGFSSNGRLFVAVAYDGGSSQPDRFRLWIEGVEQTPNTGALSSGSVTVQPWAPDTRLKGWVDLHTHPMSNIAFGGKLFHGAPSVGSLMPAVQMPNDPECRFDVRATSIDEALSQDGPTRGDPIQSRCGDVLRNTIIKAIEGVNGAQTAPAGADGFPAFTYWPRWDDITHQKMWVDWIRRSWQYGQRVMVALSHNNRVIGDLVTLGGAGAITGVTDDKASSALQIEEIKTLVADHSDFMAVARTPDELRSIVEGGRLAVVLGVELDKIGNFGPGVTQQTIEAEIDALHATGVRYVLPIHLTDNFFGDAAIYQDFYNLLNVAENGAWWNVGCAARADEIGFEAKSLGSIFNPFLPPGAPPFPSYVSCRFLRNGVIEFDGHVNARTTNGLTSLGDFAVKAMMKRGMIVDVDHMSDRAANATLAVATAVPGGGYPVMSGHTGIRSRTPPTRNAENSRTTTQLARIACLGGMFGLGTDGAQAVNWTVEYARGYDVMRRAFAPNGLCPQGNPLGVGFMGLGTDTNSLVKTPGPSFPRQTPIYDASHPFNAGVSPLTQSVKGNGQVWDYNTAGVAHYGMFADFLRDVRTLPANATMNGRQIVDDQMMYGADYFYRMWLKADTQKVRVP